ncbi:uncharacterized protein L969DRAFT_99787 [Mixia osmundae IAM 14324]|uniref:AP-2 complex subunit sigma n=1 Tax=Mixia osmundae (strain CBS 9802 / IAM 14324 / JCM 22182 / KY 12970) TaxID=764103 RepID=G7E4N5_MIXOS|nr:uncharacterized protein L969DRAFT_99787 [Mixia osmundae IAM 14324]KEI37688.1 hypothetical protein L969DRAFT_99787 [Mixia osmundae IAM 14324]GAA97795.1 hypothetical protein E5Q_04474 [Mixia osmundae IAM 14324]
MSRDLRVCVIGSGISAICLAMELRAMKFDTFTMYERETRPVGTWMTNTYLACECDVKSHYYSHSKELSPDWSRTYAGQEEILEYWMRIWNKYHLQDNTRFDSNFVRATWDSDRSLYVVDFEQTSNRDVKWSIECEVLVSALGSFSQPIDKPVGMKGLDSFNGPVFHSAKWRHDVDLSNKRVGVIGNGASASQFIPALAKDPTTHVINFSRTPSWYYPRDQGNYSSLTKAAFRYVPGLMRAHRIYIAARADMRWPAWVLSSNMVRHIAEETAINFITSTAPAKYHNFLIPTYPMGCKRVILSDPVGGYLDCLNQSNVELITDKIDTINETGIRGASGEQYDFDVLILGTGFDVTERGLGIEVKGSKGTTLTQQWKKQGGPQAYLGTTVSNTPNFMMMLGPNVATGIASVVFSSETQASYIAQMIKKMRQYDIKSFELKTDSEERYNQWLHKSLKNTVWTGGCSSWYRLENGKVVVTWPGTLTGFWLRARVPTWSHYTQLGGTARIAFVEWRKTVLRRLAFLVTFVLAVRYYRKNGPWKRIQGKLLMSALMKYSQVAGYINGESTQASSLAQQQDNAKSEAMIRFVLIQNRQGKTRLSKWYTGYDDDDKVRIRGEVHRLIAPRDQKYQSNFVEFRNHKIVYRRYAGLFFCIGVDANDNELAYLEAIHLFVEVLDAFFGNVCELDLVFNFYKVYAILDEVFLAGEIEETSKTVILRRLDYLEKLD